MIKCDFCIKEFKNKKSMTNHRRWHDLPVYKEFQKSYNEKMPGRIGSLNYNWKDGKFIHNKVCKDCGVKVSHQSQGKCSKCHGKDNSGPNNHLFGKPPVHGKFTIYKEIKFRSMLEANYAKYLDDNKIKWEYEPTTFNLGNCTYTPDFFLSDSGEYIETKGYWRQDAKEKFNLFRKLYSSINIRVIIGKGKNFICEG